jgi:hypothetical protein
MLLARRIRPDRRRKESFGSGGGVPQSREREGRSLDLTQRCSCRADPKIEQGDNMNGRQLRVEERDDKATEIMEIKRPEVPYGGGG